MWAYWHSLSVGSGKPVSWRMKIRLTSECIMDAISPVRGNCKSIQKDGTFLVLPNLHQIKGSRLYWRAEENYSSKNVLVATRGGNRCKYKEKFWKNERMSRIFFNVAKICKIHQTELVHFGAFSKKCEKWCFLESPSARNPQLSQISRLSARNPRLSQMRNDKLA